MSKVAASGFATAIAIALIAGMSMANPRDTATASLPIEMSAPRVPIGQCQITYAELSDADQPAPMECEHAHWLARSWGGRVMQHTESGMIEAAAYQGHNDFSGVPASELPRAGYCRAWLDGVDASAQPSETDCRTARRIAAEQSGRVLFMPL